MAPWLEVDERSVTWEGLLRCDTLLGVKAGIPEIRRLTGVGRAEGLRSLLPIAEGVRRPAGGPTRLSGILSTLHADNNFFGFMIRGTSGEEETSDLRTPFR